MSTPSNLASPGAVSPSSEMTGVSSARAAHRRRGTLGSPVLALVVLVLSVGLVTAAEGASGGPIGLRHALLMKLAFGSACVGAVAFAGELRGLVRFTGLAGRAVRLLAGTSAAAWCAIVAEWPSDEPPLGVLTAASLAFPPVWLGASALLRAGLRTGPRRLVVVGCGDTAQMIEDVVGRQRRGRFATVGRVRLDATKPTYDEDLVRDVRATVEETHADAVLVAFCPRRDHELVEQLRACDDLDIELFIIPRFFELVKPGNRLEDFGGFGILRVARPSHHGARLLIKRLMDVSLGGVALLIASPLLAAIAVALVLDDGLPIFYRQERVGWRGRHFGMLKFRSMHRDAASAHALRQRELLDAGVSPGDAADILKKEGAARVTRVGRFLRKTSLDELPQLINVIQGDMSLVGPRPLPLSEAPGVEGWHHRRHDMRPGITGLWQVQGRSETPWKERMRLDYLYVRNWSLTDDLRIMVRTVGRVAGRDGAH